MRGRMGTLFVFWWMTVGLSGQEPRPRYERDSSRVTSKFEKIYYTDNSLVMPVLHSFPAPSKPDPCDGRANGTAVFNLVVDSLGRPRNVMLERPIGDSLDGIALLAAEADSFDAGKVGGEAVAVGILLEVHVFACTEEVKNAAGSKEFKLKLEKAPEQKVEPGTQPGYLVSLAPLRPVGDGTEPVLRVGNGVSAPVIVMHRDPEYSDDARRKRAEGSCELSLVVDSHGMPQNVKVVNSSVKSLDRQAIEAVGLYRFHPAIQGGKPVAVSITVMISFKLHKRGTI